MSTTSLFVELVVIGVGALLWVSLFVAAFCGHRWIPIANLMSPGALLGLLAIVYFLGILTDRIADQALAPWDRKLLTRQYDDKLEYYNDHRTLRTDSPELSTLLDYGRSRMRVCRGWVLNCVLIAIALGTLRMSPHRVVGGRGWELPAASVFLLLALFSLWVWRDLTLTEYQKVERQSKYVRGLTES